MSFGELQLKVEDLWAGFPSLEEPDRRVLRGIDFFIRSGEILGFMGPSGCGKTLTALTVMGLTKRVGAKVTSGRILFFCNGDAGRKEMDLMKISEKDFRKL
ncbi:MAG: ATP-binding cassette domain-containing protein, partial [Bacillota bacterium]|nr:ATP-binding cassette domain-containing protein [Bacillota bacterium]